MGGVHIVPSREFKRAGVRFVLGRVRYEVKAPEKYEIKVVKRGYPKVALGKKGVYVLNDELIEKLLREHWENYIRDYKRREIKTKREVVEPPIEVTEEELRNFLVREGISPSVEVGWVNLHPEIPDFGEMAEKIKKIIGEVVRA